jgi:hypothetical protein
VPKSDAGWHGANYKVYVGGDAKELLGIVFTKSKGTDLSIRSMPFVFICLAKSSIGK